MAESLKEKTAKGLFWGAMNSGSTQVLNILFGIFLARLLSPADYGIIGILTIFTLIAGNLQSSGFTQALVNIRKPTDNDYNSVFWFNVLVSLTMYVVLFFCAPLIADFFHQPCLTSLSRFVFLSFFISSFGIAQNGYMMKNMMNKEMAIIGFIALIVSGATGITLAFLGKTYWALVWQQIAYISVTVIGKFFFVKEWRPRLTLDFGPVKQMAPFAMNILVTKIVNTVSNNILTNIFGKLFPDRLVGNYSQAYKWDTMANSLVASTVGQIAQAVLVEASPSDHYEDSRELQVFRKMLRFTCFLSMPLMFGFALVANEFILITIGDKWTGCVPLLQVLCLSGAFVPLYTMYQNLAMSQGRSDIFMWLNIGQIALQIVIVMLFYRFSMLIMVCAYSIFMILWLIPWHIFTGRLIRYRWTDAFKDIAPFALSAMLTMAVTYWATNMITNLYILISIRFCLAAAIYYGIMKIAKVQILRECEQFILKRIKK